jgi:hypothetical protein
MHHMLAAIMLLITVHGSVDHNDDMPHTHAEPIEAICDERSEREGGDQ